MKNFLDEFKKYYNISETDGAQKVICCIKDVEKALYITNPSNELSVGSLQKFLDWYLQEFGGKIDYIHGDDVVKNLSKKDKPSTSIAVSTPLPDTNSNKYFVTQPPITE